MEINIENYLSQDEMKEIAKDIFAQRIKESISSTQDINAFITNLAYYEVFKKVDTLLPENYESIVADKVVEILSNVGSFHLFQKEDYYTKASKCQIALDNAVNANLGIIDKVVAEKMESEEFVQHIVQEITDSMWNRTMTLQINKREY